MHWGLDEIILFVIMVAVFCVVLELAFRLGHHHRTRSSDSTRSHLNALQAALLGLLALLLGFNFARATSAPMNLLIQSLTDVYNVNEKRRAALDNHVPATVINLLFVVAIGALGFIGYGYGLGHRRRHGSTVIFAILIAMVFTIILDLDQPRSGFIRVGEESMLRLQEDLNRMSSGSDSPLPRKRKSRQERIAGNADSARSHICQVRNQTIACQSLSAG